MLVELASEWKSIRDTFIREDGYIVWGREEVEPLGKVFTHRATLSTYKIIGEASFDDAMRQFNRLLELSKDENCVPPPRSFYFYRIVVIEEN
jgi:hypothetical protein